MNGFDVSKSSFIGPTPNIQMVMPFETSVGVYMGGLPDEEKKLPLWEYTRLLPASFTHYKPLYEAYYAGLNGRNDIIAHGTALDPALYVDKTYYPFTPTLGCLCSKEIWDDTGTLVSSDQQKLNMAIMKAGGPSGYVIVLDIDNQKQPVSIEEIKKLLQL